MHEIPNVTERKGKNGTSYLIRVSAGYDANGRQIKKSMTWKPEQGLSEKKIEKELIKIAADFERKVKSGDVIDLSNMKLSDFCNEYLKMKKDVLAPETYARYKITINTLIIPQLGHMKVKDIRPIHVQRFIGFLGTPEACTSSKGGTLSASSISRYFVVLKSILSCAFKLGLTNSNPTAADRLTLPPVEQPEVEVFSEQEAAHMLMCLETEPLMWQALINIAIVTGIRRGELTGLQWEDIDFKIARFR